MDFPDIMEAFLLDPTPGTRARLQEAVLRSARHDPRVSIPALLETSRPPAADQEAEAQAVIDTIWAHMPGLFLSPQAHGRLARAYDVLGRAAEAEREGKIAGLALESIRGSGTGDEDAPYQVLRIEDEYDLLAAAGQRSRGQELRETAHGALDVHTLVGGGQVCFELLWRRRPRS